MHFILKSHKTVRIRHFKQNYDRLGNSFITIKYDIFNSLKIISSTCVPKT